MSENRPAGEHASHYSPLPSTGSSEQNMLSPGERAEPFSKSTNYTRWIGIIGGLVLAAIIWFVMPEEVPHGARVTAATASLMAVWWMTEALPIPATALVPLVVFPLLIEGSEDAPVTVSSVGAKYGSDTIFLFMGGFLIALAMQRWNLHRRIALIILSFMGERTGALIAGFMIATAFLSMWVSNTATAVLMLPIGLSVLVLVNEAMSKTGDDTLEDSEKADDDATGTDGILQSRFGTALMLGIAYAASIGSVATIIGTPPNTLLVGYLRENQDINIQFGQWMLVGTPVAIVMLVAAWFVLTKMFFKPEIDRIPGGRDLIRAEMDKLGPVSQGEWRVLTLFVLAAVSWIALPILFEDPPIDDAGIAMTIGLLLFFMPAGHARGVRLLDWESAVELPWGVLLLFGGGLALSDQFTKTGLTDWIGESVQALDWMPLVALVVVLTTGIIFLTEITSNTATAATFIPVVAGVAMGLGYDPLLLTIPVALAATCAFMLPVATPPNAVAYGSGYVRIADMVKGGVVLNVIGIVIISIVTMTIAVGVFSIAL